MSHPSVEDDADATTFLRHLREECAQIYELSVEEHGLIQQLCEMMSEVQSFFKIGVDIPPSMFASKEEIKKATLSIRGDMVLVKSKIIESQPLSKFDSPTVVAVLTEAAMKITDYAKKYREDIGGRISLLEKLAHELKKLHDLNKLREEDVTPDQYMVPEISSENLENTP
jgi:hypothetical protein